VQFAQDQDHSLCCVSHRELHNAYYFMHEGLPMIYSDGYNWAGSPSSDQTFPIVPLANYLGEYGDNQMPDVCYLHISSPAAAPVRAGAMRISWPGTLRLSRRHRRCLQRPKCTVVFFAINNKVGPPGDILFDDGITRTSDAITLAPMEVPPAVCHESRFSAGSVLSQLSSTRPRQPGLCKTARA